MKLIIKLSDLANSHEEEPFRLLSHETCSVADFHGSPESIGFVFSHAFSQGIRWSSSIRQKYGHWRRFVGKLPAKKLLTFPWTFQGSKAKLSKLSAPLTLIKFCAYPLLLLSRRFSSSTYSLYWRTFYGDQSHISCRNDANLMTLSNLHKSITAFPVITLFLRWYKMTLMHGVWKSQKKSHSTLRAKPATFTFWVDKS